MKILTKTIYFILILLFLIGCLLLGCVLHQGKLQDMFAQKNEKKIAVLLYHHILKNDENKLYKDNGAVMSYNNFHKQMKYLHDNNYNVITMNELYEIIYNKKEIPDRCVVITFDDGYLSNYTYAYNIMKKLNLKGSIFLITSMINDEEPSFDADKLDMLSWDDINKMKDVFDFYSHTHDMHKFEAEEPSLTYNNIEKVSKDLEISLTYSLDSLAFSYPFGAYNEEVIEEIKKQNIKLAFTVKSGYLNSESNPFELNRFVIYPNTNIKQFIKIVKGTMQ